MKKYIIFILAIFLFSIVSADTNVSDANGFQTTSNATFGEKLTFKLGEIIDNIIDGWIRIDGKLNVTDNVILNKNLTVDSGTLFVDSNSNNVGIGTSSPTNKLEIADSAQNSAIANYVYSDTLTDFSRLHFAKSHSDTLGEVVETIDNDILGRLSFYGVDGGSTFYQGAYIQVQQDGAASANFVPTEIQFYTSTDADTNMRMIIDKSGKVGIGTITPAGKLNINGTGALLNITNGTQTFLYIDGTTGKMNFGGVSGYNNSFTTFGSIRITGSPQAQLFLHTTASGNDQSIIRFHNSSNSELWRIYNDINADKTNTISIKDSIAGADRLVINPSGNVGIGTTTPNATLSVVGNATIGTLFVNGSSVGIGTSSPGKSFVVQSKAGSDGIQIRSSTDKARLHAYTNSNADGNAIVDLYDSTDTAKIRLNTGGDSWFKATNLGIGTTAPSGLLNINGTGILLNITNGTGQSTFVVNGTGGFVGIGIAAPTTKLEVYEGDVNFSSGSYLGLYWQNSSRRLGIGTAAPTGNLHVNSSAPIGAKIYLESISGQDESFYFREAGVDEWLIQHDSDDSSKLKIWEMDGGDTVVMTLQQDGKVGIGITNPASSLSVYSLQSAMAVDIPLVNLTTAGAAYSNKGAVLHLYSTRGTGTDDTNLFLVAGGSSGFNPYFSVRNTGNVGIGTTKATHTLTVAGYINVTTLGGDSATAVCWDGGVLTTCSSSERYKENITAMNASANLWNKYMQMQPIRFEFINDTTDKQHFGFSAEKLYEIAPNYVFNFSRPIYNETIVEVCNEEYNETIEDNETICYNSTMNEIIGYDNEIEGVFYNSITSVNTMMIQDLKRENEMLKSELCSKDPTYSWC